LISGSEFSLVLSNKVVIVIGFGSVVVVLSLKLSGEGLLVGDSLGGEGSELLKLF
jgi:hypothetical protein